MSKHNHNMHNPSWLCLVLLSVLLCSVVATTPVAKTFSFVPPFLDGTPAERLTERASGGCYPGYPEIALTDLPTCCWYNSYSCCTPEIAPKLMPSILGNLTAWAATSISKACYEMIASVLCLPCSPNTASFVQYGTPGVQINICMCFCRSVWTACEKDVHQAKIPNVPATVNSSYEFCHDIFKSDARVFLTNSNCFTGGSSASIEAQECLPKKGSDTSATAGLSTTTSSPSSTTSNSDDEEDERLLQILVGLVGTLVALISLLLIGLAIALIYRAYRRWREGIPWDIDPEEEEDEIQMHEITRNNSGGSKPGSNNSSPFNSSSLPTTMPKDKPVKLYRSNSQGIPVHLATKNAGEKDI